MNNNKIIPLLCKKNNISFICMTNEYKIVEYDKNVISLANEKEHLTIGSDVQNSFWEFIGLENEIQTLHIDNEKKEKSISIPMMYKNNIYYDVEIELFEIDNNKYFIAYFTIKTDFLLSYTKMLQDINEKTLIFKKDEEKRDKKEQYHELINKKLLTFHVDLDGIITGINDTCSYFFALGENDMIGKHFSSFFKTRESNIKTSRVLSAKNLNGDNIFFHTDILPLTNKYVVYENIILCQDITYLKKVEEELAYAAGHDSLTGLANRSNLLQEIENAIVLSKNNHSSLAICFIDLDKFKPINDNHGHHAGDMILKHISNLLSNLVREDDVVARIGGDEFIILFKEVQNKDYIHSTIQRIKTTVTNTPLLYTKDNIINFSFSVGVSFFPSDGEDATTLLEAADKNMYLNKKENI